MQVSPPPRWWWDAEQQWRQAANKHELTQLRINRIRELQALQKWVMEQQKLPEFLILSSKYKNTKVHPNVRPTPVWIQRPVPWEMTDFDTASNLDVITAGQREQAGDEQGMWGAARGWAVGALLLLAALLILRATDKCLTKGFFRGRRRRSEEWTTPSVQATRPHPSDIALAISSDTNHGESSTDSVDLPPPYSAVSIKTEEPPPPYSACYTHPKDELTVTLYDERTVNERQAEEAAHSNSSQVPGDQQDTGVERARLAPIASREISIESEDIPDARNATTC